MCVSVCVGSVNRCFYKYFKRYILCLFDGNMRLALSIPITNLNIIKWKQHWKMLKMSNIASSKLDTLLAESVSEWVREREWEIKNWYLDYYWTVSFQVVFHLSSSSWKVDWLYWELKIIETDHISICLIFLLNFSIFFAPLKSHYKYLCIFFIRQAK